VSAGNVQPLRKMCRNPRCRLKLPEPTENVHAAFCTRGCWEQFHRRHCVVCEREFKRGSEAQRLCPRRKCKSEMKRWPALHLPFRPHPLPTIGMCKQDAKNPREMGTKTRVKSLRGWCWVEEGTGRQSLLDRDGKLAAVIVRREGGWAVAHPRTFPDPHPVEMLDAAIGQAETLALAVLAGRRVAVKKDYSQPTSNGYAHSGALLSRWVPSPIARDTSDCPDIPRFLSRAIGTEISSPLCRQLGIA
jgi:hypothetical protein